MNTICPCSDKEPLLSEFFIPLAELVLVTAPPPLAELVLVTAPIPHLDVAGSTMAFLKKIVFYLFVFINFRQHLIAKKNLHKNQSEMLKELMTSVDVYKSQNRRVHSQFIHHEITYVGIQTML